MSNYNAFVGEITAVKEIPNSDFIHSAQVLGEWVIVKKDYKVGDVGILFPVGSQVSLSFAKGNNLHRDGELNSNPETTGFLDNNRRVIALKLRGVRSEGLFLPLESLLVVGDKNDSQVVKKDSDCTKSLSDLVVGDNFASYMGVPVSQRYMLPMKKENTNSASKGSKKTKIDVPYFSEHVDTSHFKMAAGDIEKGSVIYFHSKRHGTSSRIGRVKVNYDLPRWKKLINKLLPLFKTSGYEVVVGTRRVVVGSLSDEKSHLSGNSFYGTHQFRFDIAKSLETHLTEGLVVYGEILGWASPSTPIMPNHNTKPLGKEFTKKYGESVEYNYGCIAGTTRHAIYRITQTSDDGNTVEFSQSQLEDWCTKRGLEATLEVHPPIIFDGDVEKLMSLVSDLTERDDVLSECYDTPSQISEGVILRVEGKNGVKFLKSKSFAHRVCEGHETVATLEDES